MTERDDVDERARRPARERAGDVGRRRALRADAGQEQDRLRQQPPRLADRARVGRADDGADAREPALADEVLAPARATSSATWCQSGRPSESARSWMSALPAFEVLTRQKSPPPARRQAARNGLERVAAEVRVHGQRVGDRRPAVTRLEVGGGVGARGRADVAALAVRDHEQAGRARVGADLLERAHPVGAERLEERELRLDRDDVRRDGVDDPAAEARGRLGGRGPPDVGVAAQLDRQQVEPRVEADDELAALPLDGLGEAVGEDAWSRRRRRLPSPTEYADRGAAAEGRSGAALGSDSEQSLAG